MLRRAISGTGVSRSSLALTSPFGFRPRLWTSHSRANQILRQNSNASNPSFVAERAHDTHIVVHNSLTNKKEPLTLPHRNSVIKWYTCGPTVYDHSHLGHARNYIQIDILIRILINYFGYSVDHVLGLTNIDDKIIVRAKELQIKPEELAEKFESDFFNDMSLLGVLPPTRIGRVTDHLEEILKFIQVIIGKKYAYISNGSVYFNSERFGDRKDKMNPNPQANVDYDSGDARKDEINKDKKNPNDFALWKASRDGEIGWPSPFSDRLGRPGWHIECSAVATKQLGSHLDIHAGGIDLLFPHHNNEVNQCDAHFDYGRSGPQWVNYFLHTGHLHIHGRKMSKSLKNFITIKEFLKKYSPLSLRLFCLAVPFNSDVDFNEDRMKDAENVQSRFAQFFSNAKVATRFIDESELALTERRSYERKWLPADLAFHQFLQAAEIALRTRLEDNFDTVGALRVLNDVVREANHYMACAVQRIAKPVRSSWPQGSVALESDTANSPVMPLASLVNRAVAFIDSTLTIFGVSLNSVNVVRSESGQVASGSNLAAKLDEAVQSIAQLRQTIRHEVKRGSDMDKRKVFVELDSIRSKLLPSLGYELKDLADGSFLLEHKRSS